MAPHSTSAKKAAGLATAFAKRLETACVLSFVVCTVIQVNAWVSFPSYNLVLSLWGLFCAYGRSSRAVMAFLCFVAMSMVCDIAFLAVWTPIVVSAGDASSSSTVTSGFGVTMMSANMLIKVAAAYYAMHLFSVLGGSETLAWQHQYRSKTKDKTPRKGGGGKTATPGHRTPKSKSSGRKQQRSGGGGSTGRSPVPPIGSIEDSPLTVGSP